MKKIMVLVLSVSALFNVVAQEVGLTKNATLYIIVNNVLAANNDMEKIIKEYSLTINNAHINNSKKTCEYELFASEAHFLNVLEEIENLGLIELKEIKSFNYADSIETGNFDLEYLAKQKEIYSKELIATNKNDEAYNGLFNKERELDQQIYEKSKEIAGINKQADYTVLDIKLSEKNIQDLDSDDDFSGFINMPGAESKYFRLENTDDPAISNQYFGGSLRYMFTKGRSYFLIGVIKPISNSGEGETVDDIVTYGIGKDFYPRYFGQGRNTFLNPFSGFEIGGMILTSESAIDHMFTLEPHIGVELFKNKYVIIDTRIGYLFPLDQDYVKSRRGFTHNVSINIVF